MSDQPEALRLADALDTALLYGLRALSAAAELRRQHAEIEALKEELETERVRLAACGVVAMANTPETASKCREMRPEYRSASCDDVAKAVDREMALRAERDALRADAERYRLLRRGQKWSVIDGNGETLRAETLDAAMDAAMEKK